MSDMQWRRSNGETGQYSGRLVDLGYGIPRELPDHGIRRALFDLAFGWVSGFPFWDVLVFSARSLFPQRVQGALVTVEPSEMREPQHGEIVLVADMTDVPAWIAEAKGGID